MTLAQSSTPMPSDYTIEIWRDDFGQWCWYVRLPHVFGAKGTALTHRAAKRQAQREARAHAKGKSREHPPERYVYRV